MAYNGNIELISGLKPKNGKKIPLVNAPDIQVDDTGKRLDERLAELGEGVSADAAVEAMIASEAFTNLSNKVNSNADSINSHTDEISSLGNDLTELSETVSGIKSGKEYDITYEESVLSLLEDGEVKTTVTIEGGGGGTGGVATVITLTRITDSAVTVLYGDSALIAYNFTSEYAAGGGDTGDGTANWYVGSRLVATETIPQGANSFDISKYLTSGSNDVKLTVRDDEGNLKSIRWTVNAINMYVTSTFNDTQTYSEDATFRYTPYGDVEKTVYFILDGEEFSKTIITSSGRQQSITIPHQTHGAHSLKVYCTATINNKLITSNAIYFDIMFTDEGNTAPIIRCAYDGSDVQQYSAKIFKYSVYTPGNLTSNVTLAINNEEVSILTVDRTEQTWSYKPSDFGEKILTITSGDVVKTLKVNVTQFPYTITPVTDGLQFDFNPNGRTNNDENYNEYENNGHTMTVSDNFDWINGGWKVDQDGNSYFCVKAGTTMTLSYPLFGDDAKVQGKNFKMIYKATQCRDFDADVMSCLLNNVGIQVKAQGATLYAGGTTLSLPYCEDSYMELEFNIQNAGAYNEILGLIDADYSRAAIYSDTDNFDQRATNADRQALPMTFGSEDCDVWIYRFKAYSKYLNDDEILDNRIADAPDSEEMATRYLRNLITQDGELDPNLIAQVCPDLRVIMIDCPRFTLGKDDTVENCIVQQIYVNGGAKHNWTAKAVALKGQGTSSNQYGDSSRNMDIDCTEGFTFTDNTSSDTYAMTDNSVGVNYFNIKVNVASSENANNSRLANDYNTFQPYLRQARKDNPKVRDTMEFHPCVVFVRETDTAQANQFNDGNYHFYSCGDFGNSKKNNAAMGMDESNPLECIVELLNNTSPQCLFQSDDLTTELWDGEGAVEFRYPSLKKIDEATATTLKRNFQRLLSWVVSTDTTKATNRTLNSQELAWVQAWGATHTMDTAEFRLDKFKNQVSDYFVVDSLVYHYLFTERHCMVDNRAKNTFIHTSDGILWDYVFDYDNDTAKGNDNEGGLTLDYGMEDIDTIGTKDVFNASSSVLWINVRNALQAELQAMFVNRESAGAWNSTRILNDYNSYQWTKPERLEMADMRRKYLRPYETKTYDYEIPVASTRAYLEMMYGRKTHQRKKFEVYQEKYMSSKYKSAVSVSDVITLRGYTPTEWVGVEPKSEVIVTPYSSMYVYVKAGSLEYHQRAKRGEAISAYFPDLTLNDTEIYVYTASLVQELGDLSPLYVGYSNFSMAEKLQSIVIGSTVSGYRNTNFNDIAFDNNPLLTTLDIRNCSNFAKTIDLSSCVGLKTIYTTGTNAEGIIFASGGLLRQAYLNAISSLVVKNLSYVNTLSLTSYDRLTSITYENNSSIDSYDLVNNATNLSRLRMIGIDWELPDTILLERIYNMAGIDENGLNTLIAVLAGKVHTTLMRQQQLDKYQTTWTNLTITYDRMVTQFIATFKNYDGSILYTEYVDQGGTATDPVATGLIDTPTKPSTVQHDYTYIGWDSKLTDMLSNRTITADYLEQLRKYTVKWLDYTGNESRPLQTSVIEYGKSAEYEGDIPYRTNEEEFKHYYLFTGWDKATTYITGDTIVKPLWQDALLSDVITKVNNGNDITTLTPTEIYALISNKGTNADVFAQAFTTKDSVDLQLGYIPTYSNISEEVLAQERHFDGTAGYDTGISLFDEDKDFTLVLDFEYENFSSASPQVLAGCYYQGSSDGFLLTNTNNGSPSISWSDQTSAVDLYTPGATTSQTYRNICVIRHKKNDSNLYVYVNDRYSTTEPVETIIAGQRIPSIPTHLGLGGRVNNAGQFVDFAKGTVHFAKIWWSDLGANECKKICSWTNTTQTFEYCGPTVQYYDINADNYSSASFIAKGLLDREFLMTTGSATTGGWRDSAMKEWINKKVYEALPILWKQLIKKVQVRSLSDYNSPNQIITSEDYLYVPALVEMNGAASENYASEGTIIPFFASPDTRIKANKNGEGIASTYWLRSPNVNNTWNSWYAVDSSGNIIDYYSPSQQSGICICFSI